LKGTSARQQQREQTRARLVEAALRVFALHGYDHATVEEISLAAGHSKGAYYFHFDSKEEIFLELLSLWIAEQTRRLRAFESAETPVAVVLLETLGSLLRYDDRDPHWRPLLPEFWAQAHRNQHVRGLLSEAYARWLELLKDLFEKTEREGLLSLAMAPDVVASVVLAAHDGFTVRWRLRPTTDAEPTLPQMLGALMSALTLPPLEQRPTAIRPSARRTAKPKL
jgi:TetR/AcrR family transcriptional repressor of nem operon